MSILSTNELRLLADKCSEISDSISNEEGFVTVRDLADWFSADLILRPLLVEGMLASRKVDPYRSDVEKNYRKWAVLLDNEQYKDVAKNDIDTEEIGASLPPRLRNTIAHELVHSVAFRATEFGVKLTKTRNKNESRREFVKAIEEETEKLSPLLLIPYQYLDSFFTKDKIETTIDDLRNIINVMGVSRYVFINRLRLLKLLDKKDILYRPGLKNIAIGIGQWTSQKSARFNSWPIFSNFDNNILPELVINLLRGKVIDTADCFKDPLFCLSGGSEYSCKETVLCGTTQAPRNGKMKITCSIELGSKQKGSEFLFLIKSYVTL